MNPLCQHDYFRFFGLIQIHKIYAKVRQKFSGVIIHIDHRKLGQIKCGIKAMSGLVEKLCAMRVLLDYQSIFIVYRKSFDPYPIHDFKRNARSVSMSPQFQAVQPSFGFQMRMNALDKIQDALQRIVLDFGINQSLAH